MEQARTPECEQVEHRSPVFDAATPDEQQNLQKQGTIPTLSIHATSSGCGQLAESTEDSAARGFSTIPSPDEQDAAVQLLLQQYSGCQRRESLASEQAQYAFCMGCSYLFSQLPVVAVVVRPRPSCCDHAFCRGCYEAAAGERLAQWPCPECERQVGQPTTVVSAAESPGLGGPGVATVGGSGVATAVPGAMFPRPTAGPSPCVAAQQSSSRSTAAVMPEAGPSRPNTCARRPVLPAVRPASVRPKVRPASGRPSSKTVESSARPGGSVLEGAICKKRGGSDAGRSCVWVCDEPGCQFVAQSPRHARRHITTHNSERPFLCKWPGCGYRAKQREHLKTHELTHSMVKPYKCHICDFATKRKEHLTRHIKRHGDSA